MFFLFGAGDFLRKSYAANLVELHTTVAAALGEEIGNVDAKLAIAKKSAAQNKTDIENLRAAAARSHKSKAIGCRQIEKRYSIVCPQLRADVNNAWQEFVKQPIGRTIDGFREEGFVSQEQWQQKREQVEAAVKTTVERVILSHNVFCTPDSLQFHRESVAF